MDSQNRIGIYWRKDRVTVVCLASQGRDKKLIDCFSITAADEPDDQRQQVMADRISQECRERRFKFGEVYVALDCALFMQHRVHSDFSDPRKIAATIRFDTEETLATDVSDMAVSFRVASSNDNGSMLDVFTAQRSILSDILMSLQSNDIDPVAVDPDVYCLSRFLSEYASSEADENAGMLCAMLSDSRGYLVSVPADSSAASTLRAFLVGSSQDRASLLAREALVTTALAENAGPVGKMWVVDTSGRLDMQTLGEKVTLPVEPFTPATLAGVESEEMAECSSQIDLVAAYGAALGQSPGDASVSLRNDHMPYLGKKARMQRAIRFLSISLSVLLLSVGIYAQVNLLKVNRHREALKEKLEPDYLSVMLNKRRLPPSMDEAVRDVDGELRRVRRGKSGAWTDDTAVPARLAQILEVINSCAKQIDLRVDTMNIGKTISLVGSTADRTGTQTLVDALANAGLGPLPNSVTPTDGRFVFRITLNPDNTPQ